MNQKDYSSAFDDGYNFVVDVLEKLASIETPEGRRALSDAIKRLRYSEAEKTPPAPILVAQRGRKVSHEQG